MLEKNKLRDFNIKELTLLHNLEKNLLTADSVDIYIIYLTFLYLTPLIIRVSGSFSSTSEPTDG